MRNKRNFITNLELTCCLDKWGELIDLRRESHRFRKGEIRSSEEYDWENEGTWKRKETVKIRSR